MDRIGHWHTEDDRSAFRVFAPDHDDVAVVLLDVPACLALQHDGHGHWHGQVPALAEGSRYLIEVGGQRVPDPASRLQPDGVHGPSAVAAPRPPASHGWTGVSISDAVVYELHLGTFTPAGTLAGACERLPHLAALGITVIELMPIAAFPGERNWGYDGTYPFALHAGYGTYADLQRFIEAAHALGMAVLLDVVHNHFGPEGNYSAISAPYTKDAPTPWGAAINFDSAHHHGIRDFFLENVRYWIQDAGFDGLRMDAVSLIFDGTPTHFLREATDLAHAIGRAQGRQVLMIAEHLRNDRHVTAASGFGFDTQWNDDVNDAVFAFLTGERSRHCANFGSFGDVVRALDRGFVLDGTRFDHYRQTMTGTDPGSTHATEHLVHLQNHDQVGNRLHGDRMSTTHGSAKALLGVTAVFASAFVPMLFMGEEYGEVAPFLFFEDFSDPALVDAVRQGRRREFGMGCAEPPPPHERATFETSKLRWERLDTDAGRATFNYYQRLIALKRAGTLGPRDRGAVRVSGDASAQVIRLEAPGSTTVLNFSSAWHDIGLPRHDVLLASAPLDGNGRLPPYAAIVIGRR